MVIPIDASSRERNTQVNANVMVVKHLLDNIGIAVLRYTNVLVIEITVVVVKPQGEALDNTCWQLGWTTAPLFGRVTLEKRLIQLRANKLYRLLFERLRFFPTNATALDNLLGFFG